MALTFRYSDPRGIDEPAASTDLGTDTVRFGTIALAQSADVGEPAVSGLEIDDPNGSWNFAGLRSFYARETSAPSNNQIVWRGVIEDRRVSRADSFRTTTARRWSMDLVDYNWNLGKRVLVDADSKRPDETAGDRIRWLLASAAHVNLNDYGHVTYPTDQMEANDYRGQRATDVLADCAVETGYTFFCEYNEAHERPELFFFNPNSTTYTSTLKISNDYTDWDGVITFAPYEDAILTRSPTRIAYGVYLAYANGSVYVRNDTTGEQFAKIDQTAPMSNVKHAARARRIATHFLNDNDEEDDRITCAIKVPAAQVNDLRAGQRLQVKFTHLPGYESFIYMRVLRRTVIQEEEGGGHRGFANTEAYYKLELELTPTNDAGDLTCSTALSGAVTLSVDTQPYTAPGLISSTITPVAGTDCLIISGTIASNHNTPQDSNVTGTSGFTTEYSHDVGSDAPWMASLYKAVVGASGSYNITATYTPGSGPSNASRWALAAAAIRTSATAPVQAVHGFNPDGITLTLPGSPTPGNMFIWILTVREEIATDPSSNHIVGPGGPETWTILAKGSRNRQPNEFDVVYVLARCVDANDTAGPYVVTGTSHAHVGSLMEWAIT